MKQLFSLGLAFALIAPAKSLGDGMFVAPKWAKQKDINEPNQKAIIIYDAGRENMILQVKYEGPLKEFGWLIPVPAVPTVTQGSVKCFYELSQYTQRNFYTDWNLHTWEFPARGRTQSIEHTEPPVTVIETKTVGDYKITILSAKDSGALAFWLKKNRYYFPTNQNNVVDCYLKRHWSFVAVKINLGRSSGANSGLASQLADGELNPLQISFDTGRCIFPLRISSGNGRPSEVQVYVLSPEPLFERAMLEQKLPLIYSNDMAHANRATEWQKTKAPLTVPGFFAADYYGRRSAQLLAQRTEEAEAWTLPDATSDELLPYAKVTTKDLPETARFIPWLAGRTWWLTKQTWNFKPEAMQDLVFEPAIPYFANQLSSKYGYFGAAELAAFETDAVPTVLVALRSPDPAVRINATLALDNPKHPIFDPRVTLTAFSWLQDPEPQVRRTAVTILTAQTNWTATFAGALVPLLRDKDDGVRLTAALDLSCFSRDLQAFVPEFHDLLKDRDPGVRLSGLRMLFWTTAWAEVPVNRDELAPFLESADREVILFLLSWLRQQPAGAPNFSDQQAVPLLRNADPLGRWLGLCILNCNADKDAIELTLPLLNDSQDYVRGQAADILHDLTGQDLHSYGDWFKWWSQNKSNFVVEQHPKKPRPHVAYPFNGAN